MMHGSMAWMMAFMAVFWLLVLGGTALAIVLAARALRASAGPRTSTVHVASPSPTPHAPETAGPSEPRGGARLELLDEDQRRLYELVRERGGDVPQGDLVALSGYSKAKVSRVLDQLERKDLVVRLRRGMSNRIVLSPAAAAA